MPQKKYYAVRKGKKTGIFETWKECLEQVSGFSGAEYKSFPKKEDAEDYIENNLKKEEVNEDAAVAYVDGSYLHKERKFSFGAVLFYKGEEYQFKAAFSDSELAKMRNVAGEIKGSEFVMKYCIENDIPEIVIYYDYEGIEKWCSGAWQANKEGTKAYKNLYMECSKKIKIHFRKVRGHSGDKYNDMADMLAKSALGIE